MKKKWLKYLLIAPLLLINLFNVLFILYKARGRGYLREACRIIGDYFIGFHLILFALVIVIIFSLYFLKKQSLSSLFFKVFSVFLLFFIAINLSLFSEINDLFGKMRWNFKQKKDSSLNEAISHSPAKFPKVIKSYLQMNKYLMNKTLVMPFSIPIEKDYFFRVFITPNKILKEKYNHEIANEDYKSLKNYPMKTFRAYWKIKEFKTYIIVGVSPESEKLVLFTYDKNLVFLPSDLIKQHSVNIYD
ncbi:MAG: hypothetical protein JSV96_13460 [Candidatus Aminicenantes bacterium]|nr:MAG: hypothetical protein JSV96_13460 [Candidatus Aminicenantes bacterium]